MHKCLISLLWAVCGCWGLSFPLRVRYLEPFMSMTLNLITMLENIKTSADVQRELARNKNFVPALSQCILFVSKKLLDPYGEKSICFPPNKAVIVGTFHKIHYLFSEMLLAYKENKAGSFFIFQRIMYESYLKMRYLIDATDAGLKEYRKASHRVNKKIYEDERLKNDVANVINRKFLAALEDDGFTLEDLNVKTTEQIKVKDLVAKYEHAALYGPLYGMSSGSIHSDWHEIRQIYLTLNAEDKTYCVQVGEFFPLQYRILNAINLLMLDAIKHYLFWFMGVMEWDSDKGWGLMLKKAHKKLEAICKCIEKIVVGNYKNNPDLYFKI